MVDISIANKERNIILVGGTGLYIKDGLYDYEFKEESNNNSFDEMRYD